MEKYKNIFRLHNEAKSCDSDAGYNAQLIEYDVRMREEENKYSQLLAELKRSRWFAQSEPYTEDHEQTMKEYMPSDMEITKLTEDEILHGCNQTMEQAILNHSKPSVSECYGSSNKSSTRNAIAFQYTVSIKDRKVACYPVLTIIQSTYGDQN